MSDPVAETSQLLNVMDAIIAELDRQGLAEVVSDAGIDIRALAKAILKAAEGADVVPFRSD